MNALGENSNRTPARTSFSLLQNSLVQAADTANGRAGEDASPLSGNRYIHFLNGEVAVDVPESEVVRVHQVRDQSFGNVVDKRVEAGLVLARRGCAPRAIRVAGGRLAGLEAQVEEVRKGQREEQARGQPQGERRPEGASEQDEQIGNLDGKLWGADRIDSSDGGQELQGHELLHEAESFEGDDDSLNGLDAAQRRAERIRVLGQARGSPRIRHLLARQSRLAINCLRHDRRRRGQRSSERQRRPGRSASGNRNRTLDHAARVGFITKQRSIN